MRMRVNTTGLIALILLCIGGGSGVVFIAAATSHYPFSFANSASISTNGGQCVRVGEPLYPTSQLIPLQSFVAAWQNTYQVTVNETAGIVTLRNPGGGGIGSITASTFSTPIISC